MLFSKNISNQGRNLLKTFGRNIFIKSFNNNFNIIVNKKININSVNFMKLKVSRNFSTNNNINEKESIELIEAGVFEVLKSAQKLKHDKLNRSATMEELGFDSLDVVELVVAMEEKFGIEISEDDANKINSVLDAIQIFHSYYVKSKTNVGTEIKEKNENTSLK